MLNEYVYCPRLFYLEWAQGEWADNVFTEEGHVVLRRADQESGALASPSDTGERPLRLDFLAATEDAARGERWARAARAPGRRGLTFVPHAEASMGPQPMG